MPWLADRVRLLSDSRSIAGCTRNSPGARVDQTDLDDVADDLYRKERHLLDTLGLLPVRNQWDVRSVTAGLGIFGGLGFRLAHIMVVRLCRRARWPCGGIGCWYSVGSVLKDF